jgi:hypothetical protein
MRVIDKNGVVHLDEEGPMGLKNSEETGCHEATGDYNFKLPDPLSLRVSKPRKYDRFLPLIQVPLEVRTNMMCFVRIPGLPAVKMSCKNFVNKPFPIVPHPPKERY